ncbi:MAG: hypothetical protein WCH58_01850 [Candidatus Saccharibacteria bacterium]
MQKIKTFYVLDFDRCLGDIESSFDLLKEVVQELSVGSGDSLQTAREGIEATGGSFSALKHLAELNPGMDLNVVDELFLERAKLQKGNTLEPGAIELIEFLIATNRDFCIMSFGDKKWQMLKINASGLGNVANIIVPSRHKSAYIAKWLNDKQQFVIPADFFHDNLPRLAAEVVLIDDKIMAFDGLPAGARGYLVQGKAKKHEKNQFNSYSSSVKLVKTIDEIINYEK